MKKCKNQLLPFLLALFIIANSYCSNSNTSSNGNPSSDTTTPQPTQDARTTPDSPPSRLTDLERELESIKNSIMVKEREISSRGREAELWAFEMTREGLDSVEKQIAEERFAAAKKVFDESREEKEQLEKMKAEKEQEINILKNQ